MNTNPIIGTRASSITLVGIDVSLPCMFRNLVGIVNAVVRMYSSINYNSSVLIYKKKTTLHPTFKYIHGVAG